jgi:hypothetical protein
VLRHLSLLFATISIAMLLRRSIVVFLLQVLGLTASPDGMERDERRRKGRPLHMGLQNNMNAWLVTVPSDGPLRCVSVK